MANYNRVILAGNLTRDPELSYTPSNTAVCKFGLAVNRVWTNKQTGQKNEDTMFIDCTAWARSAEVINQYMRKGNPILIEGRLAYETWTSQEGQKRSRHAVVVDNFQFLGGPPGGGGGGGGGGRRAERQPAPASAPSYEDGPPPSDDVPF
jgi:single-strand DNA-binding protein